jgi:hypothetical protein
MTDTVVCCRIPLPKHCMHAPSCVYVLKLPRCRCLDKHAKSHVLHCWKPTHKARRNQRHRCAPICNTRKPKEKAQATPAGQLYIRTTCMALSTPPPHTHTQKYLKPAETGSTVCTNLQRQENKEKALAKKHRLSKTSRYQAAHMRAKLRHKDIKQQAQATQATESNKWATCMRGTCSLAQPSHTVCKQSKQRHSPCKSLNCANPNSCNQYFSLPQSTPAWYIPLQSCQHFQTPTISQCALPMHTASRHCWTTLQDMHILPP